MSLSGGGYFAAGGDFCFRIVQKVNSSYVYSNAVKLNCEPGASYDRRNDWHCDLTVTEACAFSAAFTWQADCDGNPGSLLRAPAGTGLFEAVPGDAVQYGHLCAMEDEDDALKPGLSIA